MTTNTASSTITGLDPKQWRTLTEIQRYQVLEGILIKHSRYKALMAEIDECAFYANHLKTSSPPCIVILGETGAGKTKLVEEWLRETGNQRIETPEGSIIHYLYISVPTKASIKGTAAALLTTLGDPNAGRGTQWNMVERLHKLITECQVRMIFVDEFQHIVDKETQRVLHAVADFLKDLINQTHVPMVLIGRLGEAEPVLRVNPQLDRRVGTPLILKPFEWDRERPQATILEFRALMDSIDKALPFDPSGLSDEEMAYRFYYATNGFIGWIMHLIRHAASRGIKTECATLNLALLEAAYEARIAGTSMGNGKVNPFANRNFHEASVPLVPIVPIQPQLVAGQQAISRRGKQRKTDEGKPKQRVSDVVKKS